MSLLARLPLKLSTQEQKSGQIRQRKIKGDMVDWLQQWPQFSILTSGHAIFNVILQLLSPRVYFPSPWSCFVTCVGLKNVVKCYIPVPSQGLTRMCLFPCSLIWNRATTTKPSLAYWKLQDHVEQSWVILAKAILDQPPARPPENMSELQPRPEKLTNQACQDQQTRSANL